ncbi:MAG: hypothetical protein QM757_38465 [Paludibaculum sp.]
MPPHHSEEVEAHEGIDLVGEVDPLTERGNHRHVDERLGNAPRVGVAGKPYCSSGIS